MEPNVNLTLGLDLGTNSIGWALVEEKVTNSDDTPQTTIIGSGVRIFQEAVNDKDRTPKNQKRREARSARRTLARYRMRRDKLVNLLVKNNLLPADPNDRELLLKDLTNFDPYKLRAKALNELLQPYELGRVFFHLNQRRGFKSNRKESKGGKDDDSGKVKESISILKQKIIEGNFRTLGELLNSQTRRRNSPFGELALYTERQMFIDEFNLICKKQQEFGNKDLIPHLEVIIYNCIFHQRPLRIQKNLVGRCTFEPFRRRAPKGHPLARKFRMLQELNNLTIKTPGKWQFRSLDTEERLKLLSSLETKANLSWSAVRKILGTSNKEIHEGEKFNLETENKEKLNGLKTEAEIYKILDKKWLNFSAEKRENLCIDLLTIEDEVDLIKRLENVWQFSSDDAKNIAKISPESGYGSLSIKAIRKILPYLEQGLIYDKACQAAGYDHTAKVKLGQSDRLDLNIPNLRNPVVQKALYEIRKVINAIIRKYGKPGIIRVEMARDLKLSRNEISEINKRNSKNQKENEKNEKILINELNIKNPSREDIVKYKLWEECKGVCPYTGTSISREMIFSGEVDVEHIIPYHLSLDDSYMNKTLCIAHENRSVKRAQAPYHAYAGNKYKYDAILSRVKNFPTPKRNKFEQVDIKLDDFVSRQLNDTRYICKEVCSYLKQLGTDVQVSRGEVTALLRRKWKLEHILPKYGEESAKKSEKKNRLDHRHHAIDAIVVALTSRSLLQKLSNISARDPFNFILNKLEIRLPWASFYEEVKESVDKIIVSHAPFRKLSDALHEDTAYGYLKSKSKYVVRKKLTDLTEREIEDIVDPAIKGLVRKQLAVTGLPAKKAFIEPILHKDGKTKIFKARVTKTFSQHTVFSINDKNGSPYKYFCFGNNYCVRIVTNINLNKTEFKIASSYLAAQAIRNKLVFETSILTLFANDMILSIKNGKKEFYRLQRMSDGKQLQVVFQPHNIQASKYLSGTTLAIGSPDDFLTGSLRKIEVDPIGQVTILNAKTNT